MSRTAVKLIAIAYAIALMFTYVMRDPPGWLASVAVTVSGSRSIHVFGHRIDVSLDVTRSQPQPVASPRRSVWLETPATISFGPLQPDKTGPFPQDFTYHTEVEDTNDSAGVNGR